MKLEDSYSQLGELFSAARSAVILVASLEADDLAAAISLSLSLEASGKEVAVFASQLPEMKMPFLSGLEKLRADFGQKDLTISLDYPLEAIEKVSSQEEGDRLRLVIKVKPESASIKPDQVKVSSQDFDYQLGVVIGDPSVFPGFDQAVGKGNWIWLSKIGQPNEWAKVSLVDSRATYSESVARIIQGLGLPFDQAIAGNLFEGIKRGTSSFDRIGSYKTLETAALCYKVIQGNGVVENNVEKSEGTIESGFSEASSMVEEKEGGLPSPKIFKGATTPRV